jgi:hypothetical protein
MGLLAISSSLAACGYHPSVPNNVIRCQTPAECPAGFRCVDTSDPSMGVCCSGASCGNDHASVAPTDGSPGGRDAPAAPPSPASDGPPEPRDDAGPAPDAPAVPIKGASDAAADGASVAACPAGATCFDFESYPPHQAPGGAWTSTYLNNGSFEIDNGRSFSGRQSLHFTFGDRNQSVLNVALPPAVSHEIYGRAMIFLDYISNLPWTMVTTSGVVPFKNALGMGNVEISGEYTRLRSTYFNDVADGCLREGTRSVTLGKWMCLQWHLKGAATSSDPAIGEAEVSLDGCPIHAPIVHGTGGACWPPHMNDLWYFPSFQILSVGIATHAPIEQENKTQHNLWYDDIVVSAQPIDCPTPPVDCSM